MIEKEIRITTTTVVPMWDNDTSMIVCWFFSVCNAANRMDRMNKRAAIFGALLAIIILGYAVNRISIFNTFGASQIIETAEGKQTKKI
jgi:hypothetical protein